MHQLTAFAFLLFAGLCHARIPFKAGGRIVGGSPSSVDEYPSIVQVDFLSTWSNAWSQSCGANIINNLYVVSAAHCFEGFSYLPSRRRIRAGATNRNSGGILIPVQREFNHPSYGNVGLDGDITVVRLSSPLSWGPTIQNIVIPQQGTVIPDNLPVVHAGWGDRTQGGNDPSPVLLKVQINTINNELCRQRYHSLSPNLIVTPNMICAGVLDVGGRDACQGDSGGPLYYENILIGVVSWGHGCANDTFPGISAAVAPYTNWIVQTAV